MALTAGGRQVYECKACRRNFTEDSMSVFSGMRFPEAVVLFSISLVFRFNQSFRKAEELLGMLCVRVTWVAIFDWTRRFPNYVGRCVRRRTFTRQWYGDEAQVEFNGIKGWLFTVVDSNREPIAVYFSEERGTEAAQAAYDKAVELAGFEPDVFSTDGLQSYKSVKRSRRTKHVRNHFKTRVFFVKTKEGGREVVALSQNVVEGFHPKLRAWLKPRRVMKTREGMAVAAEYLTLFQGSGPPLSLGPPLLEHLKNLKPKIDRKEIGKQLLLAMAEID